ncbi:hypothetical protein [Pigmentiphaga aceris]|uniref:hypothetical protein n=1 Tax=Pigmentiphaga aceris TaxID=1940612 RepID=UPI001651DAB5|nr:hypothetical protein [Pigmentiphaga aceris]
MENAQKSWFGLSVMKNMKQPAIIHVLSMETGTSSLRVKPSGMVMPSTAAKLANTVLS